MQSEVRQAKSSSKSRVEFLFELFIVEEEPHHQEIRDTLQRLFDEHLLGQYRLRVINVSHHPEKAAQADVLATPTLIKHRPRPTQRVVGDLVVGESLLEELLIP